MAAVVVLVIAAGAVFALRGGGDKTSADYASTDAMLQALAAEGIACPQPEVLDGSAGVSIVSCTDDAAGRQFTVISADSSQSLADLYGKNCTPENVTIMDEGMEIPGATEKLKFGFVFGNRWQLWTTNGDQSTFQAALGGELKPWSAWCQSVGL